MKIISIGEILWDLIGRAERLGGAPFNFAAHSAQLGHTVYLVSAVGQDDRGRRAIEEMQRRGLTAHYVYRAPHLSTGVATVSLRARGQPEFTIHRPAAYEEFQLTPEEIEALANERPDWIYCGTLAQTVRRVRQLTEDLIGRNPAARVFYDVNLRPGYYTPALARQIIARATVVKLNEQEAAKLAPELGAAGSSREEFCRSCAARFNLQAVCLTRGEQGCAVLTGEEFIEAPGYPVQVADAVGAGDAFAAAFLHGFAAGWPPQEVASFANRAGALVASRPDGVPDWTLEEAEALRTTPHRNRNRK